MFLQKGSQKAASTMVPSSHMPCCPMFSKDHRKPILHPVGNVRSTILLQAGRILSKQMFFR
eukprot:3250351-Amphidinium_carterae.1